MASYKFRIESLWSLKYRTMELQNVRARRHHWSARRIQLAAELDYCTLAVAVAVPRDIRYVVTDRAQLFKWVCSSFVLGSKSTLEHYEGVKRVFLWSVAGHSSYRVKFFYIWTQLGLLLQPETALDT